MDSTKAKNINNSYESSDSLLLHSAVCDGDKKLVESILYESWSVDINEKYYCPMRSDPLICDINENYENIVESYLQRGIDLYLREIYGQSLLHVAAFKGSEEIVKLLLNFEAIVDIQDDNGFTPLFCAVFKNHAKIAQLLLDHGAFIDINNIQGRSPLHVAVGKSNMEIVSLLLNNDADANSRDASNWSALHFAAVYCDRIEILEELLEHGAKVNVFNNDGESPLDLALKTGNEKCVELLLRYGARFNSNSLHNAIRRNFFEVVKILLYRGANVDSIIFSKPLLLEAVRAGNIKMINLLLDYGADINVQDTRTGMTALHYAVSYNKDCEILKILLKRGADVSICNYKGHFVLDLALKVESETCAELILSYGAKFSNSALYYAVKRKFLKIAIILLNKGAYVNAKVFPRPLLIEAIRVNNVKFIHLLLDHKTDINARDSKGNTALHWSAASNNQFETSELLIKRGINVKMCNDDGESALDVAIKRSSEECVKLLLNYGANFKQSTLHYAIKRNFSGITKILLNQGAKVNSVVFPHMLYSPKLLLKVTSN